LAHDKNRNQVIKRLRHYRRYGGYFELDHVPWICRQRK
jgi:hypothetical protein